MSHKLLYCSILLILLASPLSVCQAFSKPGDTLRAPQLQPIAYSNVLVIVNYNCLVIKLSMEPVKHFCAHTNAIHVKIMKVTGQPYFEEKKVSSHLIIVFD